MESSMQGFLTQALTMLAYQLPELIACSLVLALLRIRTRAGAAGRTLATTGALLMLVAALLRLALTLGQSWIIANMADGGMGDIGTSLAVASTVAVLLAVLSAVGLGLLGWGATQAMGMRQAHAP